MTSKSRDDGQRRVPVPVSCRVCKAFLRVVTRQAFAEFEDTHVRSCGPACVVIAGSVDDILDLPPY